MKCLVTSSIMLAILFGAMPVFAAKGGVSFIKSGCSYYIAETNMGFALLEWYGGSTPSRGDVIVGDYESYGMKEIYNLTQDSETKVWVDNFWLSKDKAIEKYFEKCN